MRFAERKSVDQVERGLELAPKFDDDGLVPVVTTDSASGAVLMLSWMNAEALRRTIDTRQAHYWSRSRQTLWHKGGHSGFIQLVEALLVDDDQDALILQVRLVGPGSCHVGYRSCFYRAIDLEAAEGGGVVLLRMTETEQALNADAVYAGLENPTRL